MTSYAGKHRAPAKSRRTVGRLAAVGAGIVVAVLIASPAAAKPVPVKWGDTYSGLVQQHCAPGTSWQALNFGSRNKNLIYAGETIDITCVAGAAAAPQVAVVGTSAQRIVNYALAQVGKSYVWGAAGPWSYDCSGLVQQALAQVGIRVPHNDQSILYSGQGWPVSRANLRPGDIVWPYRSGHVVIYIGNGQIVEAANPRAGVRKNSLYGFWTARRYV
jgi:cell wall-associated NlpC family hydrolase